MSKRETTVTVTSDGEGQVLTKTTDDRGRFLIGNDYAKKRVTIQVVEVHDDGS